MKAIKVTLKHMLSKTLSAEKPALSYSNLCTVLAMVANVVNERPLLCGLSRMTTSCLSR